MRRSITQKLGDAIGDFLKSANLEQKLREVRLVNSWEEIVGKEIARRTEKVYIKKGKLFVHLSSSVVRNELMLHREMIRRNMNERAGEELITEIVLK